MGMARAKNAPSLCAQEAQSRRRGAQSARSSQVKSRSGCQAACLEFPLLVEFNSTFFLVPLPVLDNKHKLSGLIRVCSPRGDQFQGGGMWHTELGPSSLMI